MSSTVPNDLQIPPFTTIALMEIVLVKMANEKP